MRAKKQKKTWRKLLFYFNTQLKNKIKRWGGEEKKYSNIFFVDVVGSFKIRKNDYTTISFFFRNIVKHTTFFFFSLSRFILENIYNNNNKKINKKQQWHIEVHFFLFQKKILAMLFIKHNLNMRIEKSMENNKKKLSFKFEIQ